MIEPGYKHNFEILRRAARNGDLAIVACTETATGQPAVLVCAMQPESNGDTTMVPLARMFDGNPYELFTPPSGGKPDHA